MNDAEHAYTPPRSETPQLPEALMRYLDGGDLLNKPQALRLATVDAAGWPHAALLSAGDMLAVSPQRLRFALFAQSTTAANLARDGRMTLSLALDRGMCELRLRTRRLAADAGPLALFEATVDEVHTHLAPYADMSSGLSFSLHQPEAVHARWLHQLAALKNAH